MSASYEDQEILELSENESRVLWALIKYPEETDQTIHSMIRMKKSTFSSIKTRLREQGFFERVYVPNFPKIGFELFLIMFGQLNRFSTFEERMRVAGDSLKEFVEDFYVVSESNKAFNLSISENFTEYSKNQEKFYQMYSEQKFLTREGMKSEAFPFEISRIRAFLDYDAIIAEHFNFESSNYSNELVIPYGKTKKQKLSKAEKKVLVGLVEFPEESDTFIAEKVNVSRNTVANAKKKFHKQGIVFPRIIPNLDKLGFKILVFTYRKFNAKTTMEQREEAAELVRKNLSPFFYVSKNLDGFLISAHKSFEEYNLAMDEVMRYYLKNEYITDEPITFTMSIPNLKYIKEFNFLPMVKKILGFDPNTDLIDL